MKGTRFSEDIHHILHILYQNGFPLSLFIPQTLGGDFNNIWNLFIHNVQLPRTRKPLWDFIRHHRCGTILEIGLGTGKNMEKMISLTRDGCDYYCFDDLSWLGSQRAFQKLKGGKNVHFYIGDTRETLPKAMGKLPEMDLIFIDGGHDYDTCKSDWENCKKLMHLKTAVFFHDYDMGGVRKTVDEIGNGFSTDIINPNIGPLYALVRRLK